VLSSAQCWPVKHRLGSSELISHVGWTQWKVMLAAASPAKAPMLKRVVLIVKEGLEHYVSKCTLQWLCKCYKVEI
jgi:hypothetical protein